VQVLSQITSEVFVRSRCLEPVKDKHLRSEFETGGARHNLVDGFVLGSCLLPLGGPDATTCFLCVQRFLLSRCLAAPVIGSSETVGRGRHHKFGFDLCGLEHRGSPLGVGTVALAFVAGSLYADGLLADLHVRGHVVHCSGLCGRRSPCSPTRHVR
jgi:hypothetical protein